MVPDSMDIAELEGEFTNFCIRKNAQITAFLPKQVHSELEKIQDTKLKSQ